MTRIRVPLVRRLRTLACAATLVLAATLSTAACAQPGGNASGGRTAGGVSIDSLLARSERGRIKGPETAPVTIIEVSDFQCPYCGRFVHDTYAKIDSAYIKTGRARIIYINLPLSGHLQAYSAAEAAMCAGAQDKFWPMHDRLFAAQRDWSGQADAAQRFTRFAEELQLDMAAYRDCTENDRVAPLIVGDAMQAAGAGIQGTPAFILNGGPGQQRALSGAIPFEEFQAAMDALLSASPAAAPAPQNR